MDYSWQLRNTPLRLDCCTQGLILFALSITKACQSYAARQSYAKSRLMVDVQFTMSRSNVLDDGELFLHELTLGDERSFLREAQRSAVPVKTYGNYETLVFTLRSAARSVESAAVFT